MHISTELSDPTTFEIVKVFIPFANTLLIGTVGFLINRKFEEAKSKLSTHNIQKEIWANKFLKISHEYSDAVSNMVSGLGYMVNVGEEFAYTMDNIYDDMLKLSKIQWDIQNYTKLSENHGNEVFSDVNSIYKLLSQLIKIKEVILNILEKPNFLLTKMLKKHT